MRRYPPFITIEKYVGETPLVAAERLRALYCIPKEVPLAYAGRLDPMATGKLLILIGDECKVQDAYHGFDKEYQVEIFLGAATDTGDVLGIIEKSGSKSITENEAGEIISGLHGSIQLPYPHFSSKTVKGKPLHTWTLEKRLNEIEVPVKKSRIYKITFNSLKTIPKAEALGTIRAKIETIPPVTDPKKALGEDFRRDAVRESWSQFEKNSEGVLQIISFTCIASSGTYMRSLSSHIAEKLGTCGLAYSINRSILGKYFAVTKKIGFWTVRF
jgi:tRNA pseudouridine(55) synthase